MGIHNLSCVSSFELFRSFHISRFSFQKYSFSFHKLLVFYGCRETSVVKKMSYNSVYANVSRRLKLLEQRILALENDRVTNRHEWERVRRDLIAVTRVTSNLENISQTHPATRTRLVVNLSKRNFFRFISY